MLDVLSRAYHIVSVLQCLPLHFVLSFCKLHSLPLYLCCLHTYISPIHPSPLFVLTDSGVHYIFAGVVRASDTHAVLRAISPHLVMSSLRVDFFVPLPLILPLILYSHPIPFLRVHVFATDWRRRACGQGGRIVGKRLVMYRSASSFAYCYSPHLPWECMSV